MLALLLLLAVAIFVALYPTQTWAYLTHWTGPPEHTTPLEPFDEPPVFRIGAAGDVGDGGTAEYLTAAAMFEAGYERPYDMLLLLGDNVYPAGDPNRLEHTVFRPFRSVLYLGAELAAVPGNHDAYQGDGGALQMELLGMPGTWWAVTRGDVLLIGLDSNRPDDLDQLHFLEETLAETDARWRIAAFHYPPYASGYQGSHLDVREAFVPILERHGVQLVLNGHEHDYQRTRQINGVTYVVSGAASRERRTGYADFTEYAAATYHFLDINVFVDRIVVRPVNHDVEYFDEVVITP